MLLSDFVYEVRIDGYVSTSSTTSITQAELKQILGKGDVTAVFSVVE